MVRARRKLPVYLSQREQAMVLEAARTEAPRGLPNGALRDSAIIALLLYTGLRVAELAALDRQDVELDDPDSRVVHVLNGKGGKDRNVPLRAEGAAFVEAYLRARTDRKPALFLSRNGSRVTTGTIRNVVYRVGTNAGLVKHISPHKLRHSFATSLLNATDNLRLVQEALGHESVSTTQIYAHLAQAQLRAGIDKLPAIGVDDAKVVRLDDRRTA